MNNKDLIDEEIDLEEKIIQDEYKYEFEKEQEQIDFMERNK